MRFRDGDGVMCQSATFLHQATEQSVSVKCSGNARGTRDVN